MSRSQLWRARRRSRPCRRWRQTIDTRRTVLSYDTAVMRPRAKGLSVAKPTRSEDETNRLGAKRLDADSRAARRRLGDTGDHRAIARAGVPPEGRARSRGN